MLQGRINGACTLIEKTLKRSLIYLPCRHHIYELVLRSVVEVYWPATVGPSPPIFKRFQQAWPNIDTSEYETGLEDKMIAEIVSERKFEIVSFLLYQLQVS